MLRARCATIGAVKRTKTLLRQLRRGRDLTLDELARATGIDVSRLSRAERNLVDLSEAQRDKLAKYFRVDDPDALQRPSVAELVR